MVTSAAWTSFTDVDATLALSRGQYIDGSRYVQSGAFVEAEATVADRLIVRAGGRIAIAGADAPADPISSSLPVSAVWPIAVGHIGAEFASPNVFPSLQVWTDRTAPRTLMI
jgi:hypothetical protein